MENHTEIQEFGKLQKWSFGLGSFAIWFINSAFSTWIFTYYFVVIRLPISYIFLAVFIWSFWNAFNDPLVGYLSDRTHTRWGRRKPYIIIGFIPVFIIEIIVWIPPAGDHFSTFLYLLLILLLYDTFYSMVALPYDALFPELYSTEEERAEVNTIKQILSTVGLIMAFIIPGIFIGDISEREGYLLNGIVTSIIIGATFIFSLIYGVKEREEFRLDHQHSFGFIEGMKYTLKNRGFVLYTIMYFLFEYILLTFGVIIPLYAYHILGVKDAFRISMLMALLFLVGIISVAFWYKLDLKLGSRKAFAVSLIAFLFASIPILLISSYEAALINFIFIGFTFGGILYFIYLIIADVVDEDELKTGFRREGTFFGITTFFMRLAMILAVVTVAMVFTTTGWGTYTPNPDADVILGIKLIMVFFPALALIGMLICLYFFPYTKERVQQIKRDLKELHPKKLENVRTEK